MNRRWLCLTGMMVVFTSLAFAEKVSLQDINGFPELYVGDTVEIDGVNLDGKMKKDMGFYCMGVGVRGAAADRKVGTKEGYAGRYLNMERVTFVADADLAKRLLNEMEETKTYPVKIRCKVERTEEVGNVYWIAKVSWVDFCDPGGKAIKTVHIEPSGERVKKNADRAKKQP
ncbi:MAG: hypothetical protein P8123_00585 [bacterium]